MTRARVVRVMGLVAALAIMIVLVARLGPARIVDELEHVGADAAWLLVIYAAGTVVGALPYYVLFARDARPSVRSALVGRFAASGINVIVPLFGMGGEPTRLLWLPTARRTTGIAAIIVDRLTYGVASAVFLVGGALSAIALANLPASYAIGGLIGAGVMLAGAAGAIYLVSRHGVGDRLHRLVVRLRRRTIPEGGRVGASIDREIEDIVSRRSSVMLAIGLGLVSRFVLGAELFIAFRLLDVHLSLAEAYTFAAVPVLLAVVGAVVPGQLGLQEGSQALVAQAIGLDPTTAVAAVLLTRVRQLVTAAIGAALVATARSDQVNGGPDASHQGRA